MSDEVKLGPEDHETLMDLAMWQNKIASLAGVTTRKRWLGNGSAPVPAHSAAFYDALASWHFRWDGPDGSEVGGAIGLLRHSWMQNDPGYGFASDEHAMIADLHNDQAMAFFVYCEGASVDTAKIVAAAAGEEGDARFVAGSIGSYVRQAIEARFGHYWILGDAHAQKARAWVDAQPLDPTPRFEVQVEAVDIPDQAALRTLAIAWLPAGARKRVAAAAGFAGDDAVGIAAALADVLGSAPAAAKRKLAAKLEKAVSSAWQRDLFFEKAGADLRAVRLRAKRVSTAYMMTHRNALPFQAAQLLLDAPGADALSGAVSTDFVRFCSQRKFTEASKVVSLAFAKEPDKTLPRGKVPGEVELVALVPAALVPKGCVAGARYGFDRAGARRRDERREGPQERVEGRRPRARVLRRMPGSSVLISPLHASDDAVTHSCSARRKRTGSGGAYADRSPGHKPLQPRSLVMDTSTSSTLTPQISDEPSPALAPVPPLAQARELLSKLHDTVMDATARDRIYSRRELRRRASHLNRKLRGLLDVIGQMG
ncbi:MAG: hypothetical protein QM820_51025 [Minicystis sp.]